MTLAPAEAIKISFICGLLVKILICIYTYKMCVKKRTTIYSTAVAFTGIAFAPWARCDNFKDQCYLWCPAFHSFQFEPFISLKAIIKPYLISLTIYTYKSNKISQFTDFKRRKNWPQNAIKAINEKPFWPFTQLYGCYSRKWKYLGL